MGDVTRRVVRNPFTKEQREGVFVSVEDARMRRYATATRRGFWDAVKGEKPDDSGRMVGV